MGIRILGRALLLAALFYGRASCAVVSRSFPDYKCSYTLPGKNWEWMDEARIPNGVFVARDDRGLVLYLAAQTAPRGASVANEFMVGVERGMLKDGVATKRGGKIIQFKAVPCYQLELNYPAVEKTGVARIFFAGDFVYQLQLIGTQVPAESLPEFDWIMNSFEFIEEYSQPIPSQAPEQTNENNNLRAQGELVGRGLATLFFLGLAVWGIRKISRRNPPPG